MGTGSVERTFFFVDLPGFSALTEANSDMTPSGTRSVLDPGRPGNIGRLRTGQSIGDAVMCASPGPASAVDLLRRPWRRCAAEQDFPLLRAGTLDGRAVARDAPTTSARRSIWRLVAPRWPAENRF